MRQEQEIAWNKAMKRIEKAVKKEIDSEIYFGTLTNFSNYYCNNTWKRGQEINLLMQEYITVCIAVCDWGDDLREISPFEIPSRYDLIIGDVDPEDFAEFVSTGYFFKKIFNYIKFKWEINKKQIDKEYERLKKRNEEIKLRKEKWENNTH